MDTLVCALTFIVLVGFLQENLPGGVAFLLTFVVAILAMIFVINTIDTAPEKIGEFTDEKSKEIAENKKIKATLQKDLNQYQNSRNSFRYLSNDKFFEIYHSYLIEEKENLERLALEEELVERKLIAHSPMHEKLYHLKKLIN